MAELTSQRTLEDLLTLLSWLKNNPDPADDLRQAYFSLDPERWHATLERLDLPAPWQPGDCIEIVEVVTLIIPEWEWKKVCYWTGRPTLLKSEVHIPAGELSGPQAKQLFGVLEDAGLIKCELTKVVRGSSLSTFQISYQLCPGARPGPGPDPAGG